MTISITGVILLVLFTGIAIPKSDCQEKQRCASALRKSIGLIQIASDLLSLHIETFILSANTL